MVQAITVSTLNNNFNIVREILQGISAFTSIFPAADFDSNTRYFEDFPNPKSRSFPGYPLITIDTDFDDQHISYTHLKQMNYTTRITIYTDFFAEQSTPRLNSYLNAIINYLNANQTTLLNTYGLDGVRITKARDRDEIAEAQLVVGIITVDYNMKLDVEA